MKLADFVRTKKKNIKRDLRGELTHARKQNNPAKDLELKKMSDGECDNGYSKY